MQINSNTSDLLNKMTKHLQGISCILLFQNIKLISTMTYHQFNINNDHLDKLDIHNFFDIQSENEYILNVASSLKDQRSSFKRLR